MTLSFAYNTKKNICFLLVSFCMIFLYLQNIPGLHMNLSMYIPRQCAINIRVVIEVPYFMRYIHLLTNTSWMKRFLLWSYCTQIRISVYMGGIAQIGLKVVHHLAMSYLFLKLLNTSTMQESHFTWLKSSQVVGGQSC